MAPTPTRSIVIMARLIRRLADVGCTKSAMTCNSSQQRPDAGQDHSNKVFGDKSIAAFIGLAIVGALLLLALAGWLLMGKGRHWWVGIRRIASWIESCKMRRREKKLVRAKSRCTCGAVKQYEMPSDAIHWKYDLNGTIRVVNPQGVIPRCTPSTFSIYPEQSLEPIKEEEEEKVADVSSLPATVSHRVYCYRSSYGLTP